VDFYRQPEVRGPTNSFFFDNSRGIDQSIDKLMLKFVTNLQEDIAIAGPPTGKVDYGLYVDRYGKANPGTLNFKELKEMYMAHVHFVEQGNKQPVN
jgi:hypothetical protein